MELADNGVPFAAFVVRMVGLIVDDQQSPSTASDALCEIDLLDLLGRRLRPQDRCHYIRLFIRSVGPLVELLDISQEENAFGVRALPIPAHYAIEVPEDIEFLWADGVFTEDLPGGKVSLEAFQHDYVWRNQKERFGIVFGNFLLLAACVEVLPRDSQGHHFCLAAAGGHLGAISGEAVIGRQMKVSYILGVAFKQIFAGANLFHFPDIDKRLNRFSLEIVILEKSAGGHERWGTRRIVDCGECIGPSL